MDVYALVGPSGTGKSHRAMAVAREVGADVLIDDGLLIQDTRIVAGRSAKREHTKIGAIRRALFVDPEHRREVREALQALQPRSVLILGTSREMAARIAAALQLPPPGRYIAIEQVATPEEIRRAQEMRQRHGRHVIPAPTFEVKKSFSGYLLDPLRLFYRGSYRTRPGQVIEKTMVRPTYSAWGRFYITRPVIAAIAAHAARQVEGIPEVLRAMVDDGEEGVAITLEVAVAPGRPLRPLLMAAQGRVMEAVETMTALNVHAVNIVARRLAAGPRGPGGGGRPGAATVSPTVSASSPGEAPTACPPNP